ncbi:hypothetical protein QBE52_17640 [Clostridiaceae bacterium 35-E11]
MDKKVVDFLEQKVKKATKDLLTSNEIDLITKDLIGNKEDDIDPREMKD